MPSSWVIKVEGFTSGIMDHILENIVQMPGVYHVVPTRRTNQTGEWKVLVDNTKCAFIHRQLTSQWNSLVAKIPEAELSKAPPSYPSPRISSQKVRNYQDDSSDTDSYGSILTSFCRGKVYHVSGVYTDVVTNCIIVHRLAK